MLHKKSFVKKTKAGNVVKVVREHYVRDDIASGIPGDPAAAGGGGDDDGAAAAAAGGAGAAAPTAPLLLSPDAPVYAVIDTNVALHQADVLEHPAVRDVVVCETVLREAEHRNRAAGARLRALCQPSSGKRFFVFANEHHRETYVERGSGETPNDYNDRAIRVAAAWYARRVREVAAMGAGAAAAAAAATAGGQRAAPRVVLVTDDAASRAAAQAEGALEAVGTLQFARMCADAAPDLADLVARGTGGGGGGEEDDDEAAMAVDGAGGSGGGGGRKPAAAGPGAAQRGTKRQRIFREHLSPEQVAAGLAAGRLHQGTLRASRFNAFEGRVAAASCKDGSGGGGGALGGEVLISGRQDMNRAFDGDVVVVELHPEAQWRRRVGGAGGGGGDRNEPSSAGERGGGGGGGAEEDDDDPDSRGDRGAFQVMGAAHFDGDDAAAAAEADGSEGGAADEWGPGASGARPTGRVVAIARRAWRPRGYAGSLDPRDVGLAPRTKGALIEPVGDGRTVAALFVPVERRFPKIRIRTRQAATLSDKRLVVAVDGWDADSPFPEGHYVRTLGPIGDLGTETEVLIHENDINTAPFSEAVHACVPPLPWAVDERRDLAAAAGGGGADAAAAAAAAAGRPPAPAREDLRHLDVCSVDPPGCVDIDDALHCRVISEAGKRPVVYEAGVHIADVAHFVLPGTALDAEAARRATTTYLVERRIDMLPKALTEEICSLRGGVERLAFSAIWTLDADANILSTRFCKSVIRSRAALTYQAAQERIDAAEEREAAAAAAVAAAAARDGRGGGGTDAGKGDDVVTTSLRLLMRLSKRIRARRFAAGALELASPEVRFDIDREALAAAPKGTAPKIRSVAAYRLRDTNAMVEEWMLLANQSVARAIVERFPSGALLRRHQAPAPRQFEPLLAAAGAAGFTVDASSSGALGRSLDAARRDGDPYFNTLVRLTATRCMTQARYFGSADVGSAADFWHYGLAAPIYTHFTSPIRRYADVVVHRLLAATLAGAAPLPDALRDREALLACSENLNLRHRNAQMAGRASAELFTLVFFATQQGAGAGAAAGAGAGGGGGGEEAEARVVRVRRDGCVVFVPKYGIEGAVEVVGADEEEQAERGGKRSGGGNNNNDNNNVPPLAGVRWRFDEERQRVDDAAAAAAGAPLRSAGLFEAVTVRISAREGAGRRTRLVLELVRVGA